MEHYAGLDISIVYGLPPQDNQVRVIYLLAKAGDQWFWWIPGQTDFIPVWYPEWYR